MSELWPAGLILFLMACHSVLGDLFLVQPLIKHPSWPEMPEGRKFNEQTLHFVWHLTSVGWAGLGLAFLYPESIREILVICCLISAVGIAVWTQGRHGAWAFMATAALFAVDATTLATPQLQLGVGIAGAATLAFLSALHVYWAFGGRNGLKHAIPQVDGQPAFKPGPPLTLLVAAALAAGAFFFLSQTPWLAGVDLGTWSRFAVMGMGAVFLLRVIGDFRYSGLFKSKEAGTFSRYDSMLYVPLCWGLAAGSFVLTF